MIVAYGVPVKDRRQDGQRAVKVEAIVAAISKLTNEQLEMLFEQLETLEQRALTEGRLN